MSFRFKIWDQANDGKTIGLRASDNSEIQKLGQHLIGADAFNEWESLSGFLQCLSQAESPPERFVRIVDILIARNDLGLPKWSLCQKRKFSFTYSGLVRKGGGFAAQAYVILEPAWTSTLICNVGLEIEAEYILGDDRDLIILSE
jgi:hypothetical protein